MQPPSPLPDPSPQICQQLPDYPPLSPVALTALALVVKTLHTRWRTRQLMWLCIPQGSGMQGGVGPRQEGAYTCTCPRFRLLHALPPHLSTHRRSCLHLVATPFTHPLIHRLVSAPPSKGHFDHECNGAAAILNKKPIKIKIKPKLTPLIICCDTHACPCAAVCVHTRSFRRARSFDLPSVCALH